MVCNRCIMVVKQELHKIGLKTKEVNMGEAVLDSVPTAQQMETINQRMHELGFEILDDKKQKQIEKIKALIIEKVQSGAIEERFSLSDYLVKSIHKEYTQLSRLFSEVEGITIEQYFILQKIEKVKELLAYDELNLSEIAWHLGYSSVAHLSSQFKKVTGFTPSYLKSLGNTKRKSLDQI